MAPFGLSLHFAAIVLGLRRAMADAIGSRRDLAPLALLLWGWLGRTVRRFELLAQRHATGQPVAPRQPATRRDPPATLSPRLPGGFAWLLRLVPGAGNVGSQLHHWMTTDPDMTTFLEATPQAGRILRPLLRMLGSPIPPSLRTVRPGRKRERPATEPRARRASPHRTPSPRVLQRILAPPPGMPDPLGVAFKGR